jgi:hypothetical protein
MTTYCVCASLHDAIKSLNSSLIRSERSGLNDERSTRGNRSYYYQLDEGMNKSLRDQFQSLIQECHMGEMPNDWRYEVIKDLCVSFLEYWGEDDKPELEDYQGIIPEVADSIASIYTSDLFFWLFDNPSRAVFEDHPDLGEDANDLDDLARYRQVEEIQTMAHVLVDGLSEMS